MAVLKDKVIGKMASFVRDSKKMEPHLRTPGDLCVMCGAARDELHDTNCPLYTLEGIRMDLNLLFYGIRTAEDAKNNPKAL